MIFLDYKTKIRILLSIYEPSTLKRLKKERVITKDKCKKYIDYMIEKRNELVEKVFLMKDDNKIKLPVSFSHIIANVQGQMNLNGNSIVNITPNEAFELIEKYYDKIPNIWVLNHHRNYSKPCIIIT